ncbi:MAG: phosphatase [Cellulosilyticaceae bacterium]
MKFLTDMHIHTVASGHAYSTIDEIAREAGKKGLELIAITDHSPGMPGGPHEYHFHNFGIVPKELYGVRILKGIEANIIDFEGGVDFNQEMIKPLDVVIASFHPPCIPFADEKTCTRGFIRAMENPHVHIIGHPGDARYPFDHEAIVRASKETGTLLEINNASLRPGGFRPGVRENLIEMLKYCNQMDVPVIANTDAHIAYQVGEFKETLAFLEEIQFPEALILNLQPQKVLQLIGYTD